MAYNLFGKRIVKSYESYLRWREKFSAEGYGVFKKPLSFEAYKDAYRDVLEANKLELDPAKKIKNIARRFAYKERTILSTQLDELGITGKDDKQEYLSMGRKELIEYLLEEVGIDRDDLVEQGIIY